MRFLHFRLHFRRPQPLPTRPTTMPLAGRSAAWAWGSSPGTKKPAEAGSRAGGGGRQPLPRATRRLTWLNPAAHARAGSPHPLVRVLLSGLPVAAEAVFGEVSWFCTVSAKTQEPPKRQPIGNHARLAPLHLRQLVLRPAAAGVQSTHQTRQIGDGWPISPTSTKPARARGRVPAKGEQPAVQAWRAAPAGGSRSR